MKKLIGIFNGKPKATKLVIIGIFLCSILAVSLTLAVFFCMDEVTNRLHSDSIKVAIEEASWDKKGKDYAKAFVAGEIIPKDPKVVNKSPATAYVAVKVTLTDEDGEEIKPTSARYGKIMQNIFLDADADAKSEFVEIEFDETDTTKNIIKSCNNEDFYYEAPSNAEESGLFYYVEKNDDGTIKSFKTIGENDETSEIFSYVKIPSLTENYDTYFKTKFNINIEAITIGVAEVEADVDKIKEAFKDLF